MSPFLATAIEYKWQAENLARGTGLEFVEWRQPALG